VLWRGAELYRAEAKNLETMAKFGHGTPNDWIERNLYTRYSWQGVGLMLILNVALFGARPGRLGRADAVDPDHRRRHHQRHRPLLGLPQLRGAGRQHQHLALGPDDRWRRAAQQPPHLPDLGQVLGQEVRVRHRLGLHQMHERKIGWAKVKKVPPKLVLGEIKPVADEKTLEAVIANRYEVMAGYAREMRRACKPKSSS
jgi:stearoyl-CoA desaturase (delta-9 desaturase)